MRAAVLRVAGLRKRAPSPQRGESWGEGVRASRSEPPRRITIFVSALLVSAGIARAADIPLDQRRSDSDFISADTRTMQNDDTANPAMLVVLDGETLWNTKAGETHQSCADCHGDAAKSNSDVRRASRCHLSISAAV